MEDLLEDEDEDFDKDDKVIISRQTGAKKKKMFAHAHMHALVHTPQEGVDIHQENHTHTQMNKMTSSPSLLSPPLRLAAQTLCAVIVTAPRNLFILAPVKRRTFPTFFPGVCLFFSLLQFFPLRLFFPPLRRIYDTDAVIPPPASCESTRPYKVLS